MWEGVNKIISMARIIFESLIVPNESGQSWFFLLKCILKIVVESENVKAKRILENIYISSFTNMD